MLSAYVFKRFFFENPKNMIFYVILRYHVAHVFSNTGYTCMHGFHRNAKT